MDDLNIDDGGGESFSSGYDASPLFLTIPKDSIINMPKAVGYWGISGNFQVSVTEKPNWFHRKMTKLLLGWVWIDT
jgi:hypothetical protein